MTQKQQAVINEFINILPEADKNIYGNIIDYFIALDYIPQKNRSYISFKHKTNGKVIAKIKKAEIRLKFFACKDVPEKYINALRKEIDDSDGQYTMPVPPPDDLPVPAGAIMKKCTLACNTCTGGKMRYYYKFPDGKEIFRCGAYPVIIPAIEQCDIEDLKRLIFEQHNYFLSIR